VNRDEIRDIARLRRTRDKRKIAGVAGGLARHFDIDPIIPRVTLVVLAFFGGAGLILYAAIWLIVPTEGSDDATVRLDERSRTVALAIVGALAVLALLGDSLGGFGFPWPLAIIGVIVLVYLLARGREPKTHPGPIFYAPTKASNPGYPRQASYPSHPSKVTKQGPVLFWYAVATIALGLGVLGMVDLAGASVSDSAYPALALTTCGLTLLLGAFWGRAGGVILLGLLTAIATAGATASREIDADHINTAPTSAMAVEPTYELTVGEIELDLTEVRDLTSLDGRTITLDVVAGRISVVVPRNLDVTVMSNVDVGHRSVFGDESDGGRDTATVEAAGTNAASLTLDIDITFGEIDITREGAN